MEATDWVAIYGAVVASLVAIWDVIKWRRSGPRLKGFVAPNMKMHGMGEFDDDTWFIIDVDNVGNRVTTIRGIYLKGYKGRLDRFLGRREADGAIATSALQRQYPIPHKLEPGGNFKAAVMQTDELVAWSNSKRLYVDVAFEGSRSLVLYVPPIEPSQTTA